MEREQDVDVQTTDAMSADDVGFDELWDAEWRTHALRVAEEHVKREVKPVQYQAFKLHVVEGLGAGEVARRLGLKLMEVYWAKYRIGKMMKATIAETLSL